MATRSRRRRSRGCVSNAPSGARITNYKVVLHHYWYAPGPPDETTYELVSFGDDFFSGAGQFDPAVQAAIDADGHRWYGLRAPGSSGAADSGVVTRTLSDSSISRAAGTASYMTISAGCWAGSGGCTLGATANVFLELYGSRVTITDTTAPALTGPTAGEGLRAPGTRSGDEPLTFSASDNTGIRLAEIVDVTDPDAPRVVAAADYAATQSAQKGKCDYTRTKPCPDLKTETIAASPAIAGRRTLLLRVTDTAGNQTVSTVHVPRRVRSHGTARFRGSLKGRPLPPRGVTLELQAYQPGRGWRTVKTTRTRKGGRYSTRYRFNSGFGRFTFRVRLRPNDSYPYSRGTSRHIRVRVG